MKCPKCEHVANDKVLLKCSSCGEVFERGIIEELSHLDYMESWVQGREKDLGPAAFDIIHKFTLTRRDQLLAPIQPAKQEVPAAPPKPEVAAVSIAIPTPPPVSVAPPTPIVQPKPKPVMTAVTRPVPAPKPAAPPKPQRPPIDWKKVRQQIADAATSGALLRALLYLSAFMIVVSATVLVIRFWDNFSPIIQLLFMAAVPITFYAGGWILDTRLKLVQAGSVLTGIGALLAAVDFYAVYQFGGWAARVNGPVYWLMVAILCTALYGFTAWKLTGEFFDYLTLIGAGGIFVAVTRVLHTPMEWSVSAVTLSATLMTRSAGKFANKSGVWKDLARAARYLSQILIPASLFYILFSPAKPPVGQMSAFLVATVGYALLAGYFPSIRFAYAALGASIGMVLYGVRVFELAYAWYPTVAAILGLVYLWVGRWLQKSRFESKVIHNYVLALNTTALILIGFTLVSGYVTASFGKTWEAVTALTIGSLDLGVCAFLFHKGRYTALASGLLIIPFTLGFARWLSDAHIAQPIGWLIAAWTALSLLYIGIGALLRGHELHADWLHLWGHTFAIAALCVLPVDYLTGTHNWQNTPSLVAIGIAFLVHSLSFVLQDSNKYPSLAKLSKKISFGLGKSLFLWMSAFLVPLWIAVAWFGSNLQPLWLGPALVVLSLVYLAMGQRLYRRAKEYRLPWHIFVYLLCAVGIVASTPHPTSSSLLKYSSVHYALLTALLLTVASAGLLAYLYNRVIETTIAGLLFIWAFGLALNVFKIPADAQNFAYVLLGSLAYIPVGMYLNKFENSRRRFHPVPIFILGYALTAYAVINSITVSLLQKFNPWFAVAVPLIATALYVFSTSYFKKESFSAGWAWISALTFAITFRQFLTLIQLPSQYDAFAWACLAAGYMIVERLLAQRREERIRFWFEKFHFPAVFGAMALASISLSLTANRTLAAFGGAHLQDYAPAIFAQTAVVILAIVSARLYQRNWTLYLAPVLSFLPVTLFFLGYGKQLFGQPLTTSQFALAWTGLGLVYFLAAIFTDRARVRYAHPLFLGGYALLSWSVLWSLTDRSSLVLTLGFWILASMISALLVHFNRHQTWDEFIALLFGRAINLGRTYTRNLFQWLAAWAFPIWCVLFLREIHVAPAFAWLGLVVPSLAYLALVLRLQRVDSTYALPLHSAAQTYTAVALLITAPFTLQYLFGSHTLYDASTLLAFRVLQSLVVIFYAASAWIFKSRGFAHVSSWLSIFVFTLIWKIYTITFHPLTLALPWLMWATVLLIIGFALDKIKTRYAHGPYFAGYVLATLALIVSTSGRLINIYALAITVSIALVSYLVLHFGWHHSFEDFVNFFFKKADETTRTMVATIFLFFACYAAPVLLTQYLAFIKYPLPWRGVSLALLAPLYIAAGLAIRKAQSRSIATVPTWAIYSAGYALTAIGAMVSFGDETLAIYVLTLDAVVYAVSAYIFRQTFWLYLSNVLVPGIALLILHNSGHLQANWIAWIFVGLAVVYLVIGQLFDHKDKTQENVHPFAVPFYMPAFLLSAIALAVGSSDRMLALQVYSIIVIFYAVCGWLFHETLFIYPAAWLAAVPYYLAITLTPLETRWYGLAWLPLILLYIGLGRFVFHKRSLAPLGQGVLTEWLTHPAIPFYLLAYALSVSMISLSYISPLSITIAFGIATALYAASSYLFRKPAWLYASLFTAHMTLLTYFTIAPKGGGAHYLSIPFMALTWVMALLGYGFTRWITVTGTDVARPSVFRWSITKRLFTHSWSRPFFAFAVFDVLFWQAIALYGYNTTIIVASGFALLFALFSLLWQERLLAYGMVSFAMLALGAWMKQSDFAITNAIAVYGGIGFGLYLLVLPLDWISNRIKPLAVWTKPLTHCAIFLTAGAAIINMALVFDNISAAAATLAFAGALYVTMAYREHHYVLGYLGMALLEVAWAMLLIMNDISQPQWYAIPAGLYFIVVAYLEWHRNRKRYAMGIEILGLGVLLLTAFMQSLHGADGFPYFVLLMVESLLVIAWGVYQKRKVPFFSGLGASALNIIAQVIVLVNVYNINIWLVALGVGVVIMGIAVYVEFKREQLRTRSRQLTDALERWE